NNGASSAFAGLPEEIREVLEQPESAFKELEWEQLAPADDWEALQNPPSLIGEITEGGFEDRISGPLGSLGAAAGSGRYAQALSSARVVGELDGSFSKIPGFIVPIEFSEDNKLMEFFLVPYFGACFHLPPPPPNQIVHVTSAIGADFESVYDPVWILGRLKTATKTNHIATAAYSMDLHSQTAYTE
ncbi:MAG: DUF3299 domain-containing protein, partial [Pseudomonadota bacterium]